MAKTVKKSTKVESKNSSKEKAKPKKAVEAKPEKKAKEVVAKKEKEAAPKKEVVAKAPKKTAAPADPAETEKVVAAKAPAVPKIGKREKAALAAIEKTTADELKKWTDYKQKYGSEKALPYSMSSVYEAGKPLQHKVLGWGYIINVQNDRLEVLFENGPKMLISNYKSS